MISVLRSASLYFAVVFAAAFGLGVLRVLLVAPQLGAFGAVALEVPVILAFSWVVAGWTLRRWPMRTGDRVAMGAVAFAILMVTEALLSGLLTGQSIRDFVAAFVTPAGALGLAGQLGFGIIPLLRR